MSTIDEKLNGEIRRLIDELRNKNTGGLESAELNPERLKKLKDTLRQNEQVLQPLFQYLLEQYLWKDNVPVRFYAVLLIDEIFRRSHRFRESVIDNFEEFLRHTAETDPLRFPLPPPKNLAKVLKERTLKIVHGWYNVYGPAYRKLQVAYDYLKSSKMFDFQRIEAATMVERERSEVERRRQQQTKEKVVKKVAEDLQDIEEELKKSLTEIDNGFRLLIPVVSEPDVDAEVTSINPETIKEASTSTSAALHGFPTPKFGVPISVSLNGPAVEVDQDNVDLVNNLKDCYKLIAGQYLPKIRQLLSILSRYGGDETLTKTLIDQRIRLEEAKRKYESLNLQSIPQKRGAAAIVDDEDDFEVVPEKEGLEEVLRPASPEIPSHIRDWSRNDSVRPKRSSDEGPSTSYSNPDDKISTDQTDQNGSDGHRRLRIPIVPYGIDLEYWENEKAPKPMIVRNNADCHRFWRPIDGEDTLQCSDIEAAAYRTRVIEFVGEFQPVERDCRAPLDTKEGTLCTRRDRYKCPFHGAIVARDEQGRPLDGQAGPSKAQSSDSSNVLGDPEFIEEVERATGVSLTLQKKRKGNPENDAAASADTTRQRLAKKVLNRSSIKRVAAVQSAMDEANQKKKFGGQWQYVYRDQ